MGLRTAPKDNGGTEAENRPAQGAAYHIVSSLFSKSDFTNRMYLGVSRRTGRSQRHPCRATPEIAIRGDFTLRAQHSVSEIADFSQRLETIGYAVPCAGLFSASVPSLSFGAALKPGSCRLTRLSLEAVLPAFQGVHVAGL